MAKKKIDDLEERVKNLRFEDDDRRRDETIKAALATEREDLMAPVLFHLGVNEDDYNLKMKYLHEARGLFEKNGPKAYANTTWSRIQNAKQEQRQRNRPWWKKVFLPGRAA